MIHHILFWKLTDEFSSGQKRDEALEVMRRSVATLSAIPGLISAEIGPNLASGEYDLIFYAQFTDMAALDAFREHPLHVAHRQRCQPYVTGRLAGDLLSPGR